MSLLPPSPWKAFTLVELLVSMALLAVIMLILLGAINGTSGIIQRSTSKLQEFREARTAFETITRRLSLATLNTYWGYDNAAAPTTYLRESELRFISGPNVAGNSNSTAPRPTHSIFFQAPLGYVSNTAAYGELPNLLNTWGYYVEFNSDSAAGIRPSFISTSTMAARYRYRLIELREPSDQLSIYNYTSGIGTSGSLNCAVYNTLSTNPNSGTAWFTNPLNAVNAQNLPADRHVLAENIVALVLLPMLSQQDDATGTALCPYYNYDSSLTGATGGSVATSGTAESSAAATSGTTNWKNQLPPVVQVTMVAVDEVSFRRIQSGTVPPSNLTTSNITGLFQSAGSNLYTNSSQQPGYAQDLATLENALQADRLNYRVFSTNVIIKGAKWSRAETH